MIDFDDLNVEQPSEWAMRRASYAGSASSFVALALASGYDGRVTGWSFEPAMARVLAHELIRCADAIDNAN